MQDCFAGLLSSPFMPRCLNRQCVDSRSRVDIRWKILDTGREVHDSTLIGLDESR